MSGRDNRGAGGGGGGGGGHHHHHQPLSSAMGKLKEKLTRAGVSTNWRKAKLVATQVEEMKKLKMQIKASEINSLF